MTSWGWILLGLGAVIIAGMAFHAGRLLFMLREQNKKQRAMFIERRTKIIDSLHLLGGAMLRNELVAAEGAIRCCELLQALPQHKDQRTDYQAEFPALFSLYREVKKLPRGEERQKFTKQQIMRMDWERSRLEADMAEQIQADAQKLLQLSV